MPILISYPYIEGTVELDKISSLGKLGHAGVPLRTCPLRLGQICRSQATQHILQPLTFSSGSAALIPCYNLQQTSADLPPQGSACQPWIYFCKNTLVKEAAPPSVQQVEQIIRVHGALRWAFRQLWSIEVIFHSRHVCFCFFIMSFIKKNKQLIHLPSLINTVLLTQCVIPCH